MSAHFQKGLCIHRKPYEKAPWLAPNHSQVILLPRNTSYLWHSCVKILIRLIFRPFFNRSRFLSSTTPWRRTSSSSTPCCSSTATSIRMSRGWRPTKRTWRRTSKKRSAAARALTSSLFCRLADFLSNDNYPKLLVNAGMGAGMGSNFRASDFGYWSGSCL